MILPQKVYHDKLYFNRVSLLRCAVTHTENGLSIIITNYIMLELYNLQ